MLVSVRGIFHIDMITGRSVFTKKVLGVRFAARFDVVVTLVLIAQ